MKPKVLTLFLLASLAISGCATKRYAPLVEPTPIPRPAPTPQPQPFPTPPVPPTPKPSPEDKTGALPAARFSPFVEHTTTYNDVVADVGAGIPGAGNPDTNGVYWFLWPKVECGQDVLYAMLGFRPKPGTTPVPTNLVLDQKKVCR